MAAPNGFYSVLHLLTALSLTKLLPLSSVVDVVPSCPKLSSNESCGRLP